MPSSPKTRERLIKVAERLFSQRGFHAVTIRNVTSAAHCNVSSINYHFGDKYGLLEAVFVDHFQEIQDRLEKQKLYSLQPHDQLKKLNTLIQEDLTDNLDFFRLMYHTFFDVEDKRLSKIISKILTNYIRPLSERLQFACQQSSIKGNAAILTPLFLYYLIVALNSFWTLFSPVLVNVFKDVAKPQELNRLVFKDISQFIEHFVEPSP